MRKQFLCLAAAVLLFAGLLTSTAYGAEAAVTLKCTEQIAADESFSAAVIYEGDSFDSASVEVTYNPEILKYRSCSGGEGFGEDGIVRISLSGGGSDSMTCKIRFQALQPGESFVTVTTSSIYNADGSALIAETRSAKVTVTEAGKSGDEEILTEENQPAAEPEDGDSEGLHHFMSGLSSTEFVLLCFCGTVIVLLLILLAAERSRHKCRRK